MRIYLSVTSPRLSSFLLGSGINPQDQASRASQSPWIHSVCHPFSTCLCQLLNLEGFFLSDSLRKKKILKLYFWCFSSWDISIWQLEIFRNRTYVYLISAQKASCRLNYTVLALFFFFLLFFPHKTQVTVISRSQGFLNKPATKGKNSSLCLRILRNPSASDTDKGEDRETFCCIPRPPSQWLWKCYDHQPKNNQNIFILIYYMSNIFVIEFLCHYHLWYYLPILFSLETWADKQKQNLKEGILKFHILESHYQLWEY